MATQRLLAIIEVDEEYLGEGHGYTEIPDKIAARIDSLPALDLQAIYLLDPKQKKLDPLLEKISLNYHHYAVSIRGERCREEICEEHGVGGKVLNLNGYHFRRHIPPQGVN